MPATDGTKTCFKCGVCQPVGCFYKQPKMRGGRSNKCKACTKLDVRKNRANRAEYYREYDRARAAQPKRQELRNRTLARLRETQPEKMKARHAVNNAVRDGRLAKQPCEVCGSSKRVHAHHEDYTKPLDVRWLCPKHHAAAHGGHFIKTLVRHGMTWECCGSKISIADACPTCGGVCRGE